MRAVAAAGWASASPPATTTRRTKMTTSVRDDALMPSLDDLIRPRQQRRRNRQAEGFRSLQVHPQLELGRLLNGEVRWPGALQDAVDVRGHDPRLLAQPRPIGQQPATFQEHRRAVEEQREVVLRREFSDPPPL